MREAACPTVAQENIDMEKGNCCGNGHPIAGVDLG